MMLAPSDLERKLRQLNRLVEATKIISSTIDEETLLSSILDLARQELNVERGTLYFVDHEKGELWSRIASGMGTKEIRLPLSKGLAGCAASTIAPILIHDVYADPRFDRSSDEETGFHTDSMLCVPVQNRAGNVVGVLQLINRKSGCFDGEDLAFLNSISDHLALAIENTLLHRNEIRRERMERELRLGREIQSILFTEAPMGIPGLDIAALSLPCFEVSGDYYDFIELEGGRLGFSIGDVSGKGVSAAIVMSSLQTALRMAAPLAPDMIRLMEQLNHLIHGLTAGRKYATLFYGVYDPATRVIDYVNAGHVPPLLVKHGEVHELESTGVPVGLFPRSSLRTHRIHFEPGDTLMLCTDGIPEAGDPTLVDFGSARWVALAKSLGGLPAEEILSEVFQTVRAFEGDISPNDDKTLVVLRST